MRNQFLDMLRQHKKRREPGEQEEREYPNLLPSATNPGVSHHLLSVTRSPINRVPCSSLLSVMHADMVPVSSQSGPGTGLLDSGKLRSTANVPTIGSVFDRDFSWRSDLGVGHDNNNNEKLVLPGRNIRDREECRAMKEQVSQRIIVPAGQCWTEVGELKNCCTRKCLHHFCFLRKEGILPS